MKLIIDIPDKVYNEYREGVMSMENNCIIGNAVFDGIPYEEGSQGDLISRSYLKQMIPAPIEDEYKYVHQILDNAPAVEIATKLQPNCNNLQQKGEWEDYSVDFYKCPECGYLLEKFCPYCQNKVVLPKGGAE